MPQLGNPEVTRGEKVEKKKQDWKSKQKRGTSTTHGKRKTKSRKIENHRNGKMMGKKTWKTTSETEIKQTCPISSNIPRKVSPVSHDVSGFLMVNG